MKYKRAKSSKKRMRLYQHVFGSVNHIKSCWTALCSCCYARPPRHQDTIAEILSGKVRAMTTQCVLAEVRALGPDFSGTAIALRKLRSETAHIPENPSILPLVSVVLLAR